MVLGLLGVLFGLLGIYSLGVVFVPLGILCTLCAFFVPGGRLVGIVSLATNLVAAALSPSVWAAFGIGYFLTADNLNTRYEQLRNIWHSDERKTSPSKNTAVDAPPAVAQASTTPSKPMRRIEPKRPTLQPAEQISDDTSQPNAVRQVIMMHPPETPIVIPPRVNPRRPNSGAEEIYPEAARRKGETGTVALGLIVDRNGRVLSANLLETSGHDMLDKAALREAYRSWRFLPGTLNGNLVFGRTVVRLSFSPGSKASN